MKTQVIQLNQNDDTISVRDKMSWSQTERILLVWPTHGHVLNRELEFNLIIRQATRMGAQLALVTHDSEVCFYARKLGIPVFSNPKRAQEHPWRGIEPRKIDFQQKSQFDRSDNNRDAIHRSTPNRMENPVITIICLGISVLSIFLLGVFILPSAKVVVSPLMETQSMQFDLSMDPSLTSTFISTDSLPTYKQDMIIEGHDTITATGSVILPDEPSIGELKFTNISKQEITIPAGTIVATTGADPVRFTSSATDDAVVSPGQSTTIAARAIQPGTSGNVAANKLVVIEGFLSQNLVVTNPSKMTGSTVATVPSPTKRDVQLLGDHLRTSLMQAGLNSMRSILPVGDTLITPTVRIVDTLEEIYTPAVGEPGDQLELSLRLNFQAQVVSNEVQRRLVVSALDSIIPDGYSPLDNTLEINQLSEPSLATDGTFHWTVTAERELQAVISPEHAINNIRGATVTDAIERLSASLPLSEQAQIVLAPSWWPRLPFLTMRIELIQAGIQ